ncbi:MAG: hypothetical protein HDS88_04950 [Bacteroidales bacterium]|nr:hypothetical protein [Bacteroidales bacterium]
MKKQSILLGLLFSVIATLSAAAAPVENASVSDLLGVRKGTVFNTSAVKPKVATPPPYRAENQGAGVIINASVIFPSNAQGMWGYNTTSWNPTRLSVDPNIIATGGGIEAGGKYYFNRYLEMMGFEEISTLSYLTSDWTEYDKYTGQINYIATTMAYNPLRDEVYGCFINETRNGYNFVRWNYDRYVPAAVISTLERPWSGAAFSADGTLYAIERNGDLYKVNISNGEMTLVGQTGVNSEYLGDAVIDPTTDTMYWSVCTDTEYALYTVNISTAKAAKLYDLVNEEQLCGMYIAPKAEDISNDAPAKISSISTSFSGTSLSGTISFYSPIYTIGQARLDAETEISYVVKANGKEIATGTCLPNKRVNVPVAMDVKDNYYFTVTTSNAAGTSPVAGTHKFVGPDTPKAPTTFQTILSGNTVTLQWSSPSSTGVNGGNVNYSAATYTVVRYPDKKVIAENVTDRKATDELPSPEVRTNYYYVLSTSVEGEVAPDVKSSEIALGPIVPPYTAEFQVSTSVAGWTIIDANADGNLWKFYSFNKCLQLSGSKGFDDWAITPAVKVKAGTSYPVSISLTTSNYYDETVEVKWGTAPTAEAMTNTLIEPATFRSSGEAVVLNGELSVAEAGTIYIGIHGCTTDKSYAINLLNVTIENGMTAAAPAAVADFNVSSPVDGTLQANISFSAPSTDLAGAALEGESALTKIEILRDGNVIATLTEGLAAGKLMEYTDKDENLTAGNHVYSVIPYNAYGEGVATEKEVLVGARKPMAPESAKFIEEGNTGKITITWTPVTTDFEGNTINSDAVTYRVIDRQYETVADGVTGTSVTIQAVPEGEQAFCQYAVYAVTAGGESDKMAATAYKPVGSAYDTPWAESFANGSVSHIFGYNYIKGQEPWQFKSSHDWGFTSQDEDNGFAYLECYGDLTALVTGKINLEGLNNPALTYYTYNYNSGSTPYTNALEVQVDNGDGNGFVTVQSNVVSETGPINQWNKVVVDLSEYDGQTVILRIEPKTPALAVYTLDNLRVGSYVEHNLTISNISAPAVADVNKTYEVSVVVTNTGVQPVAQYTVELLKGEELVSFIECSRLEPAASKTVTFEVEATILDGDYATLHAEIVSETDEVEADNKSEEVSVGISSPIVPLVSDLAANAKEDKIELVWSEPDLANAAPSAVTENFDAAESWTSTVDGWKFVDEDKAPFGGINTPNFPCTGVQSWFVADHAWPFPEEGVARWIAHSGEKFIASGYAFRGGSAVQSDDWAISPRLHGASQAVSLYAKSFDGAYLESFDVLASSTTTNLDDFQTIGSAFEVPNAWTQYRFMLPEGTRYVAFRSRSYDKFLLFIDDVTFVPENGESAQLNIKGYHVYRNDIRLTDTPVATPSYTDVNVPANREHAYFVTAVYDNGESRPSNKVTAKLESGVDGIYSSEVAIQPVSGGVIIKNLAEGQITVNTVDGRTVATAEAAPAVRISLANGIYIVSAGNKVAKVVVK